jgi:hypothetical protein
MLLGDAGLVMDWTHVGAICVSLLLFSGVRLWTMGRWTGRIESAQKELNRRSLEHDAKFEKLMAGANTLWVQVRRHSKKLALHAERIQEQRKRIEKLELRTEPPPFHPSEKGV